MGPFFLRVIMKQGNIRDVMILFQTKLFIGKYGGEMFIFVG